MARTLVATVIALVVVGAATYRLMNARTVQVLGDHVARVDTDRKVVALTFDDGPSVLHASELVDTLGRYDAHATFYVVGAAAAAEPEALRSLIASGQEIGNHSYSHRRLVFVSTTTAGRKLRLRRRRHPRQRLHRAHHLPASVRQEAALAALGTAGRRPHDHHVGPRA